MMRQLLVPVVYLSALFASGAFAAQVAKVKGKTVLIKTDGDAVQSGESFYAMADGKRKAVIKISKIKGDKALGVIVKGKAAVGMTLSPRGAGGGKVAKHSGGSPAEAGDHVRAYWGGLLGYGMDSMNVQVNNSTTNAAIGTAAMSGTGFSAKGLFDYELFSQIWFRGTTGIEQLNVTGNSICGTGNVTACNAKLMYFTLDLLGRYVFAVGNFRPWLGGGVGLLFPAAKSSTALKATSIGTTNVMLIAGGLDYFINPRMYVPVSLEYGLLPKSDEVDAHWITFRVGLAFPF